MKLVDKFERTKFCSHLNAHQQGLEHNICPVHGTLSDQKCFCGVKKQYKYYVECLRKV